MKNIIWFILFSCICFSAKSQDQLPPTPGLQIIGKVTREGVLLRWVPETPGAWSLSNQHGYVLERMEFTGEEDFHEVGYEPLTSEPIKPWPLAEWEELANQDDYAAVAAEMIYGDKGTVPANIFEKAEKYQNIFSSAILAAEFSYPAAIASGLAYQDEDIQTNKKYLYRLSSAGSSEAYPIDTAYLLINGDDMESLPSVTIDELLEKEGHIELRWKRDMHEQLFSAYHIERSVDGSNYQRLTQAPYIDSPHEASQTSQNFITYADSIPNYQPYYYRVIGITPFGEQSLPSQAVRGMARDRTPPGPPINIQAEQIGSNQMKITWDIDTIAPDLKGFMIARANDPQGDAANLTEEALSPNSRLFVDESYDELQNNWYFIAALDTANNASVAMPVYGVVIDSIPPAPPTGLQGTIDTTGIVTLKWNLGPERDIKGYMVFSTNQEDHVYANLSNKPLLDTVFIDTLNLKVLTRDIFYKVVAVDAYFNHSDFSEPLKLTKPDLIPPVAPVFTNYKVSEKGIRLTWAQSSSLDAYSHQLYRRPRGTSSWQQINEFFSLDEYFTYLDSLGEKGVTYEYKIQATDLSGLQSPVAYTLTLKAIDFSQKPTVRNVNAVQNTEEDNVLIRWTYPVDGNYKFRLYRAVNGGPFSLLEDVEKDKTSYVDPKTGPGKTYEYAVKALFADGKSSGFGDVAQVTTEN